MSNALTTNGVRITSEIGEWYSLASKYGVSPQEIGLIDFNRTGVCLDDNDVRIGFRTRFNGTLFYILYHNLIYNANYVLICYNKSIMVTIIEYSDKLKQSFIDERDRLRLLLPENISIEHVGSSAVGIGGKNIVDILIGVSDEAEMKNVRDKLVKNGYFEGNDSHSDRIFLASRKEETGDGDFHIHICPTSKDSYKDFIILRDFLISNPDVAKEYLEKKRKFAKEANFDRKKYKALKAEYVSKLLSDAKK